MIEIDGSEGEGGGQILRSSLSLAICTQQPFCISNIRANRENPGLRRQHLTAVKAAAAICSARVEGAELESRALTFRPGRLQAGDYSLDIGTAGSCTLVLQTVLPALLMGDGESRVRIFGGTHNKGSPPFDFLSRSFLPQLGRMGADVQIELARPGFYPRGGGEIRARIVPAKQLGVLTLTARGAFKRQYAEAYVAAIPVHVAQRELEIIGRRLRIAPADLHLRALPNDMGPGNAVTITVEHEQVTEVFTGFGEKRVRAETVAEQASADALAYLATSAPVDEHLADQLLLPMALGRGGSFVTRRLTQHLHSNAVVIGQFTGRKVTFAPVGDCIEVRVD